MVQDVGRALHARRAAVDLEAAPGAFFLALEHLGGVQVGGDIEVEPAVAVVVAEGGARVPVEAARDARLLCDVGEGPVAVVVEQEAVADVGDEQVGAAVVVVVGRRAARAPGIPGHSGLLGDLRERAVAVVAVEVVVPVARVRRLAPERLERRAVDDVEVKETVAVVVEPAGPGAVHLDDGGFRRAAAPGRPADAGALGDVAELQSRRNAGLRGGAEDEQAQ